MAFRATDYERFEGQLSSMPPWWPLWRATFRRGWNSRWIRRWTFLSLVPAAGFTVVIYIQNQLLPGVSETLAEMGEHGGPNAGSFLSMQVYFILLQIQVLGFLFPLAMMLGYVLLSGDMKSNALESYFARPMTPWGYVFGRTVAYTAFLLLTSLAPLLWVWVFDWMTGDAERFQQIKDLPLGLVASMTLVAVTLAVFVQALTSLTRSGMWTAMVLVILLGFSSFLGNALMEATGNMNLLAVSFWQIIFSLSNGFMNYPMPGNDLPLAPFKLSFGILLAVLGASLLFLMRRVKRVGAIG